MAEETRSDHYETDGGRDATNCRPTQKLGMPEHINRFVENKIASLPPTFTSSRRSRALPRGSASSLRSKPWRRHPGWS